MLLRQSHPNKNAEISMSVAVWADKQLESHCQQFHSYQGASSSQYNVLYETCLAILGELQELAFPRPKIEAAHVLMYA